MQLPQFIQRALSFFDKAEQNLTAATDLATATKDLATANSTIAQLRSEAGQKDERIKELEGSVSAKDTEIKELKSKLEAAEKKANTVIAAQGLDPKEVPTQEASKPADSQGESDWAKYHRLQQTDARAAGQFWAENADKIIASKPKRKA